MHLDSYLRLANMIQKHWTPEEASPIHLGSGSPQLQILKKS